MACLLRHSGNWGVDLQAGSEFGYKLLFIVLLAGLFAVYMQVCSFFLKPTTVYLNPHQVLASRLGCVTGLGKHHFVPVRLSTIHLAGTDAVQRRPCLALSAPFTRSSASHFTLALGRIVSALCALRNCHYQHGPRRTARLCDGAGHAFPEA